LEKFTCALHSRRVDSECNLNDVTTEFESNRVANLRRFRNSVLCLVVLFIAGCGDNDEAGSSLVGDASLIDHAGIADPRPNQPPRISGKPGALAMVGEPYGFAPTAIDPEGDDVLFRPINLPRWAKFNATTGRLYGTPSEADVGQYSKIDIEVTDGDEASRLGSFAINVISNGPGSIAISWVPATQRVDGSPLTNLAGHRFHWGTAPGSYTNSVFVAGAGITSYVIDGVLPDAYYIAATTVDTNGLESELSNPVTVTVQ
jgi:hypothetical protein